MQKYITNRKYIISKMVYNLANERKERIMLTEKRVHELKEAGLTKIGIMATDGTIQSRIFQDEIEKNGMHKI